jgi:predicted Zn-dependent protease
MELAKSSESQGWHRFVVEAQGYLELGMLDDAADALEQIPPENKTSLPVVALRVEIFQAAKRWSDMEAVCGYLVGLEPDNPQWWLRWGYATRRAKDEKAAAKLLKHALRKFPDEPCLLYNLGCYLCVMGKLDEARQALKQTFSLDKSFRLLAVDDPDLTELWKHFGNFAD